MIIDQFVIKTYVVGAYQNCLDEASLMSTHKIGFYGKISKTIPELSSNTHLFFSSETFSH